MSESQRWMLKGALVVALVFGLMPLADGRLRHWGVAGLLVLGLAVAGLSLLTWSWARTSQRLASQPGWAAIPTGGPATFSENTGESIEDAVVIGGNVNHLVGVRAEYRYLAKRFGRRGKDWELEIQAVLPIDGRHYDEMRLIFPDGTSKTIYFDITAVWGKF